MKRLLLVISVSVLPSLLAAQSGKGPYLLVGVLRRLEGHDLAFDAGVAHHWQWHREHRDPYVWYAWNIRFSQRTGGLVFASFNHFRRQSGQRRLTSGRPGRLADQWRAPLRIHEPGGLSLSAGAFSR
ncbi:MAG TPA: hypothetical protein VFD73_26925 [Gemmatimonadales bacterium]|nr:hypothetical protein [Gemmatimonadales bacterium]